MPKNVVVYSDDTGQDGGVRPDQRLSNVYKMYRATRVGPDSSIDPSLQVAFYDPGLGTESDARGLGRLRKAVGKLMASVAGRGIAFNIVDCYEFILNHWRPSDRIFLIGFSRGAYMVRSVAQVIALCGVPVHEAEAPDVPLRRFSLSTRAIAERAVRRVWDRKASAYSDILDAFNEMRRYLDLAYQDALLRRDRDGEDSSRRAAIYRTAVDQLGKTTFRHSWILPETAHACVMRLEAVLRADYQSAEEDLDASSYACNTALRELEAIARSSMAEPKISKGSGSHSAVAFSVGVANLVSSSGLPRQRSPK